LHNFLTKIYGESQFHALPMPKNGIKNTIFAHFFRRSSVLQGRPKTAKTLAIRGIRTKMVK
jgi:hypothetical protein